MPCTSANTLCQQQVYCVLIQSSYSPSSPQKPINLRFWTLAPFVGVARIFAATPNSTRNLRRTPVARQVQRRTHYRSSSPISQAAPEPKQRVQSPSLLIERAATGLAHRTITAHGGRTARATKTTRRINRARQHAHQRKEHRQQIAEELGLRGSLRGAHLGRHQQEATASVQGAAQQPDSHDNQT